MSTRIALLCSIVATALPFSACSKSPVQQLKAGDAAVCASEDVTQKVLEIIRQQAAIPGGPELIPDYEQARNKYLRDISFEVSQVISTSIDAPNYTANCQASVKISASEADPQSAIVDYSVTADLSNGEPIVKAGMTNAKMAIDSVMRQITESFVDEAKKIKKLISR